MKKSILLAVAAVASACLGELANPSVLNIQRTMKALEESTAERPATVRVLFYGQSIVAQGWTGELMKTLQRRYPTVRFEWKNLAIGGYTSPALQRTAEPDLYPFYPDLLFFHVYGPLANYEEIVRETRRRTSAEIVLWSSHLNSQESADPAKPLHTRDERTRGIRDIAARNDCMFIDLNRKWCEMMLATGKSATNLLCDSVHLLPSSLPLYAGMIAGELIRVPGAGPVEGAGGGIYAETAEPVAEGMRKIRFDGNRVSVVSNGRGKPGAKARILLDGREMTGMKDLWAATRPSAAPRWMPCVNRVTSDVCPVAEDWALVFPDGVGTNKVPARFFVEGSVSGRDGEGVTGRDFVSKSGRVRIAGGDFAGVWQCAMFKKPIEPGHRCTWKTYPLFTSVYTPQPAGARTVLVQNCANTVHTLAIVPDGCAYEDLGIEEIVVNRPPRTDRPKPSAGLLKRIEAGYERYGIVHFSINTFTDREWGYGSENPAWFAPTAFDADQIVRACKAGGLQGLVVVAKHHDGFCLWRTKTTAHSVAASPFRNGTGDYVKEMQLACERHGLKFGVYVSPWDRNNAVYCTPAYRKIFWNQVLELFSGAYGRPCELWFDGANGGDGWYGGACETRKMPKNYYDFQGLIDAVRAKDPDVCVFYDWDEGDLHYPRNESGDLHPDCRASFPTRAQRSTPGWEDCLFRGDPNGKLFKQPECDFPLRRGWFYHASHDGCDRSPAFLMKIYLRTCGNGGTMNVGISPDRRGLLPDEDARALAGFEAIRTRFFSTKATPAEGFNVVVMREDVTNGERVDGWEFALDGKVLASGPSLGIKRIRVLDAVVKGAKAELRVTKSCGTPGRVSYELYRADPALVAEVKAAQEPKPPKAPFEMVGIPTVATPKSLVYMIHDARPFRTVTVAPDVQNLDGTPVTFRLAFSDDNVSWRVDPAERRLDNIAANPIPQSVALGRAEKAKCVRLEAVRTLKEGSPLARVSLTLVP